MLDASLLTILQSRDSPPLWRPSESANVMYLFFLTWSTAQTSQTIVNAPIYTPRVARSALFIMLASGNRTNHTLELMDYIK